MHLKTAVHHEEIQKADADSMLIGLVKFDK